MSINRRICMGLMFLLIFAVLGEGNDANGKDGSVNILFVTQSSGFRHGSVTRKEGNLSVAERVMTELGVSSNQFRVDCTQDVAKDFTKEKLEHYEIVMFYTTGKLPIAKENLDYFLTNGSSKKGMGLLARTRRQTRLKIMSPTGI